MVVEVVLLQRGVVDGLERGVWEGGLELVPVLWWLCMLDQLPEDCEGQGLQ